MNITGIITEYNPFHNGHKYHLQQGRKETNCDGVVCIMSGNFVQRGEPALIDKWLRTKMALENGVDLIIELPTFYAISSAEFFAKGAISILDSLGVINNLYFGSEIGSITTLNSIANILISEPIEYKTILKNYLSEGEPFYKARAKALSEYTQEEDIMKTLSSSNNILGIEYLKALIKLNSSIKPYTLKREGSNYNDKIIRNSFASATSIREYLKTTHTMDNLKNTLPTASFDILEELEATNYPFVFNEAMFEYIKFKLLTDCVLFNNLYEVSEGLDKKIMKEILNSSNLDEFILKIKSKRYTYSKISRILTQIFIGFDRYPLKNLDSPNNYYARILGFNSIGREILSEIKKDISIPLITKVPKYPNNTLLELDILATKAYSILNNKVNPSSDFLNKPIIIN